MWPFKKKLSESVPYPTVGKISIGDDKFFDESTSKIVFAYAHDYATDAYGGSMSTGRVQVVIYKTAKGNYVLVPQDIAQWPKEVLVGQLMTEKELRDTYFVTKQSVEMKARNTIILVDKLQYDKEEV